MLEENMVAKKNKPSQSSEQNKSRNPPIHIPLDFEAAVDGLLQVDPKQPTKPDDESTKEKPAKE